MCSHAAWSSFPQFGVSKPIAHVRSGPSLIKRIGYSPVAGSHPLRAVNAAAEPLTAQTPPRLTPTVTSWNASSGPATR
jgi:hypothetical protein